MKKNNAQLFCQLSAMALMSLAGSVHAAEAFSSESQWMIGDWGASGPS